MQTKPNKHNENFEFAEVMLDKDFDIHFNRKYRQELQIKRDFHFHDFYEIFLFKEGAVTCYLEENAYRLMPGDMLIMPPGLMHSKTVDDRISYERIVIYINKSVLATLGDEECDFLAIFRQMEEKNRLMLHFNQDSQEELQLLVKNLLKEFNNKEWGYSSIKKAYMTEILVRICRQYQRTDYIVEPLETGNIIPQIITYINEHVTQKITLDKLSEVFFISKYHLIRKFKKYTGTTVHNYLISKKIIFVKKLLDEGYSVTDASMKAGFTDYSIFYKAFVKRMNITPKEYLQMTKL